MSKQDAKAAVLNLYPSWARANGFDPDPIWSGNRISGTDAMLFYSFIQKEHPDFLSFRDSGDRWQTVHSWLIEARISA
jgi:hypothetical protein